MSVLGLVVCTALWAAAEGSARVGIEWSTRITTCHRDLQARSICASMDAMGYCHADSPYFEFISRSCCDTCRRSRRRGPDRPTTQPPCVDAMWQCAAWAKQGHCGLAKEGGNEWVLSQCCASCADRPAAAPARRKTSRAAEKSVAKSRRSGRARNRPATPKPAAAGRRATKSVRKPTKPTIRKQLPKTTSTCVDRNTSCDAWAKSGFCATNDRVKSDCCSSCANPPSLDLSKCSDAESSFKCRSWAAGGYCPKRATVRSLCRASCGVCTQRTPISKLSVSSTSNVDKSPSAKRPRLAHIRIRPTAAPTTPAPTTTTTRRTTTERRAERSDGCRDTTSKSWCLNTAVRGGYCETQPLVFRQGGGYCCATCACFKACAGSRACEQRCRS